MAPVLIMTRIIISYKIGSLQAAGVLTVIKLKVLKILQNRQKAENHKKILEALLCNRMKALMLQQKYLPWTAMTYCVNVFHLFMTAMSSRSSGSIAHSH